MLESIEIQNFRSCDDVQLRLGEPIVALIGKNGAGKTNLLHAIQVAAELCMGEPDLAYRLSPHDRNKPVRFALEFSIAHGRYRYETTRTATGRREPTFTESLTHDGANVFQRDGERLIADVGPFREGVGAPILMGSLFLLMQFATTESQVASVLKPVSEFLRAIRYYPLLHRAQEHKETQVNPFIEASAYEKWKLSLAAGRASDSATMRILHMHVTRDSKFQELCKLLGDDGLGLISEIRVEDIKLPRAKKVEDATETAYTISFVPCSGIAGAGRPFRFSGLSEGTWRVVRLLTYLVFDASSCMLVEQPEDSIHAGLMGSVIDILDTYSDRTQLICTTHSPRVMNLVRAAGIRIVTAEDGLTAVSELTPSQLDASQTYIRHEGTLAEFLETL